MSDLCIPDKYQDQLEVIEVTDQRLDEEIARGFGRHLPVISEKNIWAFWHSGFANMPPWCKRNVIDWVRICGPEWSIRVLDNVPDSPNNTLQYVSRDLLPRAFVEGTMDGPHSGQHSADMTRTACLYEHGGTWMDVGSILIRHMDRLCWNQLEDPSSPFRVAVPVMWNTCVANHFVAARKGDPFIHRWHRLFTHLWEDRDNAKGLIENSLLAPYPELMWNHKDVARFDVDWKDPAKSVEYVAQIVCWVRLCSLDDAGDGFSCADYWQSHILGFDTFLEDWRGEHLHSFTGFGQKAFDLLALRRDEDSESQRHKEAEELVWTLLTSASMQKITHAKDLTVSAHLGTLWDVSENEGKDSGPGTFAELLRYGTVHFQQKRESIVTVTVEKSQLVVKKGILEP